METDPEQELSIPIKKEDRFNYAEFLESGEYQDFMKAISDYYTTQLNDNLTANLDWFTYIFYIITLAFSYVDIIGVSPIIGYVLDVHVSVYDSYSTLITVGLLIY